MAEYRPHFSELATEFVLSLPKRRQRTLMDRVRELARHPFIECDYRMTDSSGREIEHVLVDGFVIGYWVDHATKAVMISEIADADAS